MSHFDDEWFHCKRPSGVWFFTCSLLATPNAEATLAVGMTHDARQLDRQLG
jgi:hypothetical protein